MALRQILSKTLMPTLDRDLSRVLASEMDNVAFMVENPLASQVFGYAPKSSGASSGALGRGTAARQAPAGPSQTYLVKKHYPVQPEGLMQDAQASYHHVNKSS